MDKDTQSNMTLSKAPDAIMTLNKSHGHWKWYEQLKL